MKLTKKATAEYCTTKKFVAISFNADGSRGTNYGNCSPLAALNFFSGEATRGKRVALFPADFNFREKLGYTFPKDASQTDPTFYDKAIKYSIASEGFYS